MQRMGIIFMFKQYVIKRTLANNSGQIKGNLTRYNRTLNHSVLLVIADNKMLISITLMVCPDTRCNDIDVSILRKFGYVDQKYLIIVINPMLGKGLYKYFMLSDLIHF
jgi:hypothetical protein